MTLTIFGVLTIVISLWLMFRGTALQQFTFVILSSLLGGSSAINLPALGGSSIRPFLLAFLMLFARLVVTRVGGASAILRAVRKNVLLVCFCAYGVIGALILPRVFAGQVDLVPMRPITLQYAVVTQLPLAFSSQNITAAFYLSGTLLGVVVGDILARRPGAHRVVVNTFLLTSWAHMGLGVLGLALKLLHHEELLSFFRNASYAQLDNEYRGWIRITGVMPEASVYAGYGFMMLVITTEFWLRDLRTKLSGFTSLAMALILLLSTSSSAYVGMAGDAVVLLLRWMIFPAGLGTRKAVVLLACSMGAVIAFLGLAVAMPRIMVQLQDMLHHMTLDKANSQSAYERGIWARQGLDAFMTSLGLGVGPGSFRSSSSLLAIVGSMGVIGIITYLGYLLQVLKPWRESTFRPVSNEVQAVGVALSWTLIAGPIPALVNAASPDPGQNFAIMAAMTLVWRGVASRAPHRSPAPVARAAPEVMT
jgi:hypothetical protein